MSDEVKAYSTHYSSFASEVYRAVRAETHLNDFGQNGWMTPDEHDLYVKLLDLTSQRRLLDIGCGSGGPTLRIAQKTGCRVDGVDVQESAIATVLIQAVDLGLTDQSRFHTVDAGRSKRGVDDRGRL